jgi:hypothetical protein
MSAAVLKITEVRTSIMADRVLGLTTSQDVCEHRDALALLWHTGTPAERLVSTSDVFDCVVCCSGRRSLRVACCYIAIQALIPKIDT